ncbi:Topoisomerase 1-associated factor 1 [Sparassis crispa]|uniref:Topoisomerase 1-associated factor 1 n=1 Tax=Sparassis crispa TaxID=139825 RepID=A0A401H6B1_9APHY|nr:Topoisomerase 1-associated factor 1 [Sparassis crispa]GBE89890.1 Topoisomerase 1-associated factor 1 [Sparassis crispa]
MMDPEDAISVSSDEENEEYVERRAILDPAVRSVVEALGGYEGDTYRLGDECYGCLKDLKKFWRKDDTDDERTVARIFWETRVLPNDLIPVLLVTAGKGFFEDKCAVACADLMTAMTWPIDLAEELKELDEEYDKGADYTQLLLSHLNYKAALLRPGVMEGLLGIMIPCLTKDAKERKERDVQIVNVVLYLIRNLAFIKDLPANTYLSADQAEYSSLQSRLVKALSDTGFLDLLLTIASNVSSNAMFNNWNALVLEIFYLLFRGVKPTSLTMDQAKQPAQNLQRLLAVEDQRRRDFSRKATSRHSRFGTTISIKLNPGKAQPRSGDGESIENDQNIPSRSAQPYVLHRQQAISGEAGSILDLAKRQRKEKGKKIDELGREDNLSLDSRVILQNLAKNFIEACFNPFLASLLKDIKAERPKITEKDNLRLLYVAKWFLEFFLDMRAKGEEWKFGLIAEVTERSWIIWVLKRMREAVEEKPKLWTELQAGIECLTQLVLIIDSMVSDADEAVVEAAEVLQQQIVYNGEVLDIAFDHLRVYKEGVQSIAYLDSSVHLAYALLRMLEKWAKRRGPGGEMYVRRKAKPRRKKGKGNEDGVPDVEEEPEVEEEIFNETMFTFEMFEAKFANSDITQSLVAYLTRYKDFASSENMKRVVGLMHRQAVRAKAEGLYFTVSTLDLFKNILREEKSLPRDQAHKDLIVLINFILRKFFKAAAEDSFAFFPKNRGHWKHLSSWESEEKTSRAERTVEDTRFPPDVQVKKGYTWSEQLGVAIACLVEEGKMELIVWVKQILALAVAQRQRIIEDTDGSSSRVSADANDSADEDDMDIEAVTKLRGPSGDALAKITDYMIPYVSDEEANAATKDPHLKLVFRLVKFFVLDENADELEWYIPAATLPSDMQRSLNVINQFLETPLDLGGKKAAQLLSKKRRRRRRRAPSPDSDGDQSDEIPKVKKRKEKKQKEKQQYKSAQFIEDSDVEPGDMEIFLEKEKALRERTALAAAASGLSGTMRPTGTKKRRRKTAEGGTGKKRQKRGGKDAKAQLDSEKEPDKDKDTDVQNESDESDFNIFGSPRRSPSTADTSPPEVEVPKARPRPRPRLVAQPSRPISAVGSPATVLTRKEREKSDDELNGSRNTVPGRKKGRLQLVISDDED